MYTAMFHNSYLPKSLHGRIRWIFKDELSAFQKNLVLQIKESILVLKATGSKAGFPEDWLDLFKYFKNK